MLSEALALPVPALINSQLGAVVCVTNPSYYAVEAVEWGEGALIKVIFVLATEPLGAYLGVLSGGVKSRL